MIYLTAFVDGNKILLYGDEKDIEKLTKRIEELGFELEVELSSMCG